MAAITTSNARILCVEDNSVIQKLILRSFDKFGYEIDQAFNGQDAVQKAEQKDYTLIFMDLEMPIMEGPEATRKIFEFYEKKEKTVTIIAQSSVTPEVFKDKFGYVIEKYPTRFLNLGDKVSKIPFEVVKGHLDNLGILATKQPRSSLGSSDNILSFLGSSKENVSALGGSAENVPPPVEASAADNNEPGSSAENVSAKENVSTLVSSLKDLQI